MGPEVTARQPMRMLPVTCVIALLAASGCALEHTSDPCVEDLRPGSFELEVIPLVNFAIAGRMELARDGTFVGHPAFTTMRCAGTLTAEEHRTLVDDIVASRLPCAGSRLDNCHGTLDTPVRDILVRTLGESGDVARCNALRFVGSGCGTPLDRLVENLERGPLARVHAEGGCAEGYYEYTGADGWGGPGEPQRPPLPTCD